MSKKAIFIVSPKNFYDDEFFSVRETLDKKNIKTFVASSSAGKAFGKNGLALAVSFSLEDIKSQDYDAIIFIGGPGSAVFFEDEKALSLVHSFFSSKKKIAACGTACSILANAGILMGKKATAYPSEEQNLLNKGAEYTGMDIEYDGNIITAKGPWAIKDFAEKILWALTE